MTATTEWNGREVHFVGIGGAGMSGLALIAIELGAVVSGSDPGGAPILDLLRSKGATISSSHDAANVSYEADVVRTSAVDGTNVEVAAAVERGQRVLHRSELLAEMTRLKRTIAVTGTHGKTTTSAMVLRALRGAGIDAGWVIGAGLQDGEESAGWGSSDWLVVEADESDRSLLVLDAEVAVITNLELDHHATYSSFEDLVETVNKFAGSAEHVVLSDGDGLEALTDLSVAVSAMPDGVAVADGGSSFRWSGLPVEIAVPGLHNASNAAVALEAAAFATDDRAGLIAGIANFRGTSRRFELKGSMASGARVYDDYAHHPTEVAATIAAARTMGAQRVLAAFQPHLFSRTQELAEEFAVALGQADQAFVSDIYPAREAQADFPSVSAATISSLGKDNVQSVGGLPSLAEALRAESREGDLVLLMGAGDIGSIAEWLL
jgi:UDP-N-acetylmuramate--alanine ligase